MYKSVQKEKTNKEGLGDVNPKKEKRKYKTTHTKKQTPQKTNKSKRRIGYNQDNLFNLSHLVSHR